MKCLQFGMVSKCAKMCVTSLRLCTLEMKEVMMRLLPSVLLQLSKISATVSMAIPVLAFLSSKYVILLKVVDLQMKRKLCLFSNLGPYIEPEHLLKNSPLDQSVPMFHLSLCRISAVKSES